jgi:hypothetical protein
MGLHRKVLTHDQKRVLKQLGPFTFQQDFYLAGGTALAIHLGHRRSRDFDWFTTRQISDAMNLAGLIRKESIPFSVRQVARGTLSGSVPKVRLLFRISIPPAAEGSLLAGIWLPPGFPL